MIPIVHAATSLRTAASIVSIPSPVAPIMPLAVTTHHTISLNGQPLSYSAVAGFTYLRGRSIGSGAKMFYVAYLRDGAGSASKRPITFAYNGGPGGSSAGVHIGAFGPRAVPPLDPSKPDQELALRDNPDSLLDVSDIVFIDPVGSGYSRLLSGAKSDDFYGVAQDAAATAQFIAHYLRQNQRIESPIYLAGESYGTLRTVVTTSELQKMNIRPSGLILMGLILDNSTLFAQAGNDEPFWLFLPTEAAVANYHGLSNEYPSPLAAIAGAKAFCYNSYLMALAKGNTLDIHDRDRLSNRIADITGVAKGMVEGFELRVTPDEFSKRWLAAKALKVALADGRFTGKAAVDGDASPADPLYSRVLPQYKKLIVPYLRDDLGVKGAGEYKIVDSSVGDSWNWDPSSHGSPLAVSVGDQLGGAMKSDPKLRVFSANGIYDMTSPILAAEYTLAHIGINLKLQNNITFRTYSSGHMIYISGPERS